LPPTGVLTSSFLNFTASRGNDLSSIGLTPGCKWCLCASRWKEALDAYKSGEVKDPEDVPKVFLHATHESALERLEMGDLRKWAADGEVGGPGGVVVEPSGRNGKRVREGRWVGWRER